MLLVEVGSVLPGILLLSRLSIHGLVKLLIRLLKVLIFILTLLWILRLGLYRLKDL